MPRQSVDEKTIPRIKPRAEPLVAPPEMSKAAASIWRQIVAALPAEHFRASDSPLLRSYCEATAMADRAAAELAANGPVVSGRASAWLVVQEKQVRAQASLAIRLRLCPSARQDPKSAGREPAKVRPVDFSRMDR